MQTARIAALATIAAAGALAGPNLASAWEPCGETTVRCPTPPPPAVKHIGKANGGSQGFVQVQLLPTRKSADTRTIKNGSRVLIVCQLNGVEAYGPYGTSKIWNRLKNGGYVSDTDVYTGSDERVAPKC